MNILFRYLFLLLLWPHSVLATKPCPPLICVNNNGQISECIYSNQADWIATGVVDNLISTPLPPPMSTEQYQFDFIVNTVEKGKISSHSLSFLTGWCSNRIADTLTNDTDIRIYGLYKHAIDGQNTFIGYEVLSKEEK